MFYHHFLNRSIFFGRVRKKKHTVGLLLTKKPKRTHATWRTECHRGQTSRKVQLCLIWLGFISRDIHRKLGVSVLYENARREKWASVSSSGHHGVRLTRRISVVRKSEHLCHTVSPIVWLTAGAFLQRPPQTFSILLLSLCYPKTNIPEVARKTLPHVTKDALYGSPMRPQTQTLTHRLACS